jgi:hypothetical protein
MASSVTLSATQHTDVTRARVAINGFGGVGRCFLRAAIERSADADTSVIGRLWLCELGGVLRYRMAA